MSNRYEISKKIQKIYVQPTFPTLYFQYQCTLSQIQSITIIEVTFPINVCSWGQIG